MKDDLTCVGGRIMLHDPQPDDPDLETDIGERRTSLNRCERLDLIYTGDIGGKPAAITTNRGLELLAWMRGDD